MKRRDKTKKEGRATRQHIQKQVIKVQKLHQRLANVRTDTINKIVADRDYNASLNLRDATIYETA